jgi:hypothetical protein
MARARLRNQRLARPSSATPAEVVAWMGAMQAQERSIAKWSVGQRAPGIDEREVDRALAAGEIIRTHALRPTWHFLAADDLRWIVELTAPRVHALNALYYRRFEVDEKVAATSRTVMERALAKEGALTRVELAERLAARGVTADSLRLGYILMRAELDLVICSGASRGKQHTYALVDERAPTARPRDRDEALAELAIRYFQSHGPATLKDFTWWSSLTMADARRAVEAAGLEQVTVDDRDYWMTEGIVTTAARAAPAAHLLQGYDEYVVAYRDSRDVFEGVPTGEHPEGKAPPFLHAFVLDGRMVGTWRGVARGRAVTVEVQLAGEPTERHARALTGAVERYGAFLGKTAEWAVIPAQRSRRAAAGSPRRAPTRPPRRR